MIIRNMVVAERKWFDKHTTPEQKVTYGAFLVLMQSCVASMILPRESHALIENVQGQGRKKSQFSQDRGGSNHHWTELTASQMGSIVQWNSSPTIMRRALGWHNLGRM